MSVIEDRRHERAAVAPVRKISDHAFSRAAGAPLIEGNCVRLLKDAQENYPAWLDAIRAAQRQIHFESYIIHEDDTGREFADALIAKARDGVRVRLIYDWLGGFGKTSRAILAVVCAPAASKCVVTIRRVSIVHSAGFRRDHRKMLAVDGQVGFISGLCVGRMWVGQPEKKLDPWRDTGVEVRGYAVADIEQAFAQVWATLGAEIPRGTQPRRCARAGRET